VAILTYKKTTKVNMLSDTRTVISYHKRKLKLNRKQSQNSVLFITFSGRLLASAIFAIGKADVFDAYTQCSGMCCTMTK